ncbi:MAG: N-formylglutamate amidohydrolase [Nannocystis sp.]|nr:N-formylglutamate amidohydrolase [Nannocystis sp.]MBA3547726.1 N-formylglutamate amidohydrolase [Nannocystis sp.]
MISGVTDHLAQADRADDERLEPDDLHLEPGVPAPFEFTPATSWSPLVISFPHVGLEWPADEPRPRPAVNFARNADLEVDRLYPDASALGAATVRARYSRLLIDLNRADDDVSAALVPDHPAPQPRQPPWASVPGGSRSPGIQNRGLIWRTAVGNISILSGSLPYAELLHRLRRYYDPYHRALEVLLARRRARFGYAVLLEAHSMPGSIPGDLVLGTFEGGACSPELEARALAALSAPGPLGVPLAVRLNDPYRGGELVRKFGRPEHNIHALQLEVNRALYLDEVNLVLRPEIPGSASAGTAAATVSSDLTAGLNSDFTSDFTSEFTSRPAEIRSTGEQRFRRAGAVAAPAPLDLLHRVKSLVTALAAVGPRSAAPATANTGQPATSPPLITPAPTAAHFGEPLCDRRRRG